MKMLRLWLAVLALAFAGNANASYQTSGSTFTYSKVSFAFMSSAPAFASCNELEVEFTGLFASYPIDIMVYGRINCPAIGAVYLVRGSGSVSTYRYFSMSFRAIGYEFICNDFPESTLSGTCDVFDATNLRGIRSGTAALNFR